MMRLFTQARTKVEAIPHDLSAETTTQFFTSNVALGDIRLRDLCSVRLCQSVIGSKEDCHLMREQLPNHETSESLSPPIFLDMQ
jgi:hypothetical protein